MPKTSASTIAVVGPFNRNRHQHARARVPESSPDAIAVISRVGDQFKPACWICSCACLRELQRADQRA